MTKTINVINEEGNRYGRLLVLKRVKIKRWTQWLCLCDCGNHTIVTGGNLRSGNTRSCGCLARERSPEWRAARSKHISGRNNPACKPDVKVKLRQAWTPERRAKHSQMMRGNTYATGHGKWKAIKGSLRPLDGTDITSKEAQDA